MNDAQIEVLRVEISKLSLSAGDYLVFKFPSSESVTNIQQFLRAFRSGFPEFTNHVMSFIGDVEISIIHKDDE